MTDRELKSYRLDLDRPHSDKELWAVVDKKNKKLDIHCYRFVKTDSPLSWIIQECRSLDDDQLQQPSQTALAEATDRIYICSSCQQQVTRRDIPPLTTTPDAQVATVGIIKEEILRLDSTCRDLDYLAMGSQFYNVSAYISKLRGILTELERELELRRYDEEFLVAMGFKVKKSAQAIQPPSGLTVDLDDFS